MLRNMMLNKIIIKFLVYFVILAAVLGSLDTVSRAQNTTSLRPGETTTEQTEKPRNASNYLDSDPKVGLSDPPIGTAPNYGFISEKECVLAILVIITALICMSFVFFLLKNIVKLKAEDILRVFGVALIVLGTMFMIVSGYSSAQIAPAMGLFGTIAGYLLGKSDKKETD